MLAKTRRFGTSLSTKLLFLTILFVMLAEVLIYVPSVANFRRNWLTDRLAAAQIAAMVLEATPSGLVPRELEKKLLDEVGARTIAIRSGEARRLLAVGDMPPEVAQIADMRTDSAWKLIADAFDTLALGGDRIIRIIGRGMNDMDFVEITISEKPLRRAILIFSRNILLLSLIISGITALLVYLVLHRSIVRPVRRLSENVASFAEHPEDTSRIIAPSGRGDEIGIAEEAVQRMEQALARELREKKHLADVGLAVSKINHDLRNMLTSAQLMSDRLVGADDPMARRLVPKLVSALDRAIGFSQSILEYGKASERAPIRRTFPLLPLIEELRESLGLGEGARIAFTANVPAELTLHADAEQIFRALLNIGRNAVAALSPQAERGAPAYLRIEARRENGQITIDIADNGPGIPEKAKPSLFKPFQSSVAPGGTGLGLAIAAEIIELHGGRVVLVENGQGACFRINLPHA